MSDKMRLDWEPVQPFQRLERFRVPGGWIYRTVVKDAAVMGIALCFVPEPGPVIPVIKVKEGPPSDAGEP